MVGASPRLLCLCHPLAPRHRACTPEHRPIGRPFGRKKTGRTHGRNARTRDTSQEPGRAGFASTQSQCLQLPQGGHCDQLCPLLGPGLTRERRRLPSAGAYGPVRTQGRHRCVLDDQPDAPATGAVAGGSASGRSRQADARERSVGRRGNELCRDDLPAARRDGGSELRGPAGRYRERGGAHGHAQHLLATVSVAVALAVLLAWLVATT